MSNTKNTGGAAFPCEGGPQSGLNADPGMSLRDYFAAKSLQGLLSDQNRDGSFKEYASDAYAYADAMLKAREQ